MKFIPAEDGQVLHRLELTRRNLETLLAKLDDPLSKRQLVDPDWHVVVGATEEHIETTKGYFVPGAGQCVEVVPVENEEHYGWKKFVDAEGNVGVDHDHRFSMDSDTCITCGVPLFAQGYSEREPGPMYMPTSGETI